jgi:uncharacterized protein YegJ (DUF2314 family)
MTVVVRDALLGACIAIALSVIPAAAQTITQKAERDEVARVAKDDPTMAAAMRKARASLADFLMLAAAPKPNTARFAVKIPIRDHPDDDAEYFWIDPFANDNGHFTGRINNTPESVHSVKLGQTIKFEQSDVVDWMYMDGDKMKGNYTACALLASAPRDEVEEFKKRFGLDCDR